VADAQRVNQRLLTINTGSSSLKLALFGANGALEAKVRVSVERIGSPGARLTVKASGSPAAEGLGTIDHRAALEAALARLGGLSPGSVQGVVHRVVHGGADHRAPEPVTDRLVRQLREIQVFDPTHMPQALAAIEAIGRRFPEVPQFACFDTGFHATMPDVARRYPLPRWTFDAGVRRYGFHGLSCESILTQLGELDRQAATGRLVITHLGNGASVTAVREGVSIDTSMGFSPTGGLMMGTRAGDLDPMVVIHLALAKGLTPERLATLVNEESGLLGVSGGTGDMRDLLERAGTSREAAEAIDLYCYTAHKHIGALATSLDGIDTLVFTGGVGEHAPDIRRRICRGLASLGVRLDAALNAAAAGVVSTPDSRVVVRVMQTDEDLAMAGHLVRLLA
jgi:acetate kinase